MELHLMCVTASCWRLVVKDVATMSHCHCIAEKSVTFCTRCQCPPGPSVEVDSKKNRKRKVPVLAVTGC